MGNVCLPLKQYSKPRSGGVFLFVEMGGWWVLSHPASHSLMFEVTSEPGPTALAQKHSEPIRVPLTDP